MAKHQLMPECHKSTQLAITRRHSTLWWMCTEYLSLRWSDHLNGLALCDKFSAHECRGTSVKWEGVSQGQLALAAGQGWRLAETTAWQLQQGGDGHIGLLVK